MNANQVTMEIPKQVRFLSIFNFVLIPIQFFGAFFDNEYPAVVYFLSAFISLYCALGIIRKWRMVRALNYINGIMLVARSGFALLFMAFFATELLNEASIGLLIYIVSLEIVFLVLGVVILRYVRSPEVKLFYKYG